VAQHLPFGLRVTLRPKGAQGFVLLPRRWVAKRTLAWRMQSRRLSKDYERLPKSSEAMIYLSMTRLKLRRLTATRPSQTAS
jgi:putative transposase